MPRLTSTPPAYRLHRPSGQARVRVNGRDIYLGRFGTPESHQEYHRVVAEWSTTRRPDPPRRVGASVAQAPTPTGLTVAELIAEYRVHAEGYYVREGRPTGELPSIRHALKALRELYGRTPAAAFGPKALKAVRQHFVERGLARTTTNYQIGRIKRMFRWAVAEELVASSVLHALDAVRGLRRGRSEARETDPVRPVSDEIVERTLAFLPPVVADIVRVQRLAGMRPIEAVSMRGADIDRTDPECWEYRPPQHKTAHHDRDRLIFLGPRAIVILMPYIESVGDGFLFSPKASEDRRNAEKRAARKTPRWPSHCKRKRKARPKRSPREHYSTASYRRAISRACAMAFPHPELATVPRDTLTPAQRAEVREWDRRHGWHPHQLRHAAATFIRKQFGVEGSKVALGHSEIATTEIYAERDMGKAREIMRQVG